MEANSRKSGFAEHGLLPPNYPTGIRAAVGSQNGNKVKFSDWKKTNDKKSNVSALAKLVRDDSEDSENNEKGNIESHKSKIIPSEEPNPTTGKAVN